MPVQTESREHRKIRVLLIIHEEASLQNMKDLLQRERFDVTARHAGVDAVDIVQKDPPDVLLLEEEMPGPSAIETVKRVRDFDEKLPIFILTHSIDKIPSGEIAELGVAGFIPQSLLFGGNVEAGAEIRVANLITGGMFRVSEMIKEAVKVEEKEEISATSHEEKSKAHKKKLLIVEDEPHSLQTLKDRLEFEGYATITAEDGEAALSMAREEKPDLILLDIMLPKMDGFKVSRLLKFDERFRHIPIIMLTALVQDTDIKLGEETGADAYVTKPFDFDELIKKIKELLMEPAS